MITKVVIKNNKKTPMSYVKNVFKNKKTFNFKPGVNIIIGENGSGKSTLMSLIEHYTLTSNYECDIKTLERFTHSLLGKSTDLLEGVDVYGDYERNVFRMARPDERSESGGDDLYLQSIQGFRDMFDMYHQSTGESVIQAMNSLFNRIFSANAKLKFPMDAINRGAKSEGEEGGIYTAYKKYVEEHKVDCDGEYTILMDEPDRNLDVVHIKEIKEILSFHKEETQLIVVIHNPLLIYWALSQPHINIVELTKGYGKKVKDYIDGVLYN